MFTSTTTTKTIVGKYDTETLSEKRYDPSFKGDNISGQGILRLKFIMFSKR